MGGMDLYHIKSAFLAEFGAFSIGLNDLIDHFGGHFPYMSFRHVHFTYAPGRPGLAQCTAYTGKTSVHAAVGQLCVGQSAGVMDGLGCLGQALTDPVGIQLQLFVMLFAGRGMDNGLAVGHDCRAAHGLFFQIGDHLRRHMAVQRDHAGTGRRADDTVLHSDISHSQRGEQVGI